MTKLFGGKGQARLILSLFFLVLFSQVVVQYGSWLIPKSEGLTNLEGKWKYCVVANTPTALPHEILMSSIHCEWNDIILPGRLNIRDFPDQVIAFQKEITLPLSCNHQVCSVLLPTVTDSGIFFANDEVVARVGTPGKVQKSYVQAYPVHFDVPAKIHSNSFLLTYLAFPSQSLDRGVLRGPILAGDAGLTALTQELIVAGNIVNPLLSGWGLILLSIFVLALPFSDSRGKMFSVAFLSYSLISLIYSISLTRLPRQHLGGPTGYYLHFAFRFWMEASLAYLIAVFLDSKSRLIRIQYFAFSALGTLTLLLLTLKGTRFEWFSTGVRYAVLAFLVTWAAGIFEIFTNGIKESLKPYRISILMIFSIFMVLQTWDALALFGVVSDIYFGRITPLAIGFFFATVFWRSAMIRTRQIEVQANLGALASQVAHDIRSPLAALDSVIGSFQGIPEDKRLIVRSAVGRIRDIANHLLEKNRAEAGPSNLSEEQHSVQLLSGLIDTLISEKRMQFRSKLGVDISASLDTTAYGLFAKIQLVEFKRLLSNLINNAVEALPDHGRINVTLRGFDETIELRVTDNGKGIPPEILSKLMNRGETHGKEGGSGLGLYHAKKAIETFAGTLRLESIVGSGTAAVITLPRARPPTWFVEALQILPGTQVVVLDDDDSVHQIWRGRFESLKLAEKGINLCHFSMPEDLLGWTFPVQARFLMDYELLGSSMTGLDVIEKLGIAKQSILVTSRYEETAIRERCTRLGVSLIPKGMAGFVPIMIQAPKQKADAILLDDDELVHTTWASVARQNRRSLLSFYNPEDFLKALDNLDTETPIYIDSSLSGGVKGQDLVPRVRSLGFQSIFLATGYDPDQFSRVGGLTAIVGKDPAPELSSSGSGE